MSVSIAAQHRLTQGTVDDGPLALMLQGVTASVLYSSPPWDDAHVKMYLGRARRQDYSWQTFFRRLVSIVRDHVDGWVFIESGPVNVDAAAKMLSEVCRDVSVHATTYGPRRHPMPSHLLVGHTGQPVRGMWRLDPAGSRGGYAQPAYCIASVAQRGRILLDPCCTNVYQARAAVQYGMVFYGNDHNAKRAAYIRRLLEQT
jgi:hypothetical protein